MTRQPQLSCPLPWGLRARRVITARGNSPPPRRNLRGKKARARSLSKVLQRGNNGNDFGKFESNPILSLFHAALVGLKGFTVPQLDLNYVRVREGECPNASLSE